LRQVAQARLQRLRRTGEARAVQHRDDGWLVESTHGLLARHRHRTSAIDPRPPVSSHESDGEVLTRAAFEQLESELAELEGPKRKAVVEAIATARAHGDL